MLLMLFLSTWASADGRRSIISKLNARRSVHVYFAGPDFHLDVVPCIAPEGFEEAIWVPDRGFNKWIPSHPVGVVHLLDDLNTQHAGKVKKLGRLLKHFRNEHMKNRKPKSYWLVALLIHHVTRLNGLDMSQRIDELFGDLVRMIYSQYASLLARNDGATPNIKDPMLGHNVSWNWSREHFETFMRRLDEGQRRAEAAIDAMAKGDVETAIAKWQLIFGADYFPASVGDIAKEMAAMATPGVTRITGTGLIVPGSVQTTGTIATQATRFYGKEDH